MQVHDVRKKIGDRAKFGVTLNLFEMCLSQASVIDLVVGDRSAQNWSLCPLLPNRFLCYQYPLGPFALGFETERVPPGWINGIHGIREMHLDTNFRVAAGV